MKLIYTIVVLILLSVPVATWAQEAQSPPQPTFTDQLYLIGRSQEKQIEILQQELNKTKAELDTLKKTITSTTVK